jgi:hypothetical protein
MTTHVDHQVIIADKSQATFAGIRQEEKNDWFNVKFKINYADFWFVLNLSEFDSHKKAVHCQINFFFSHFGSIS